MSPARIGSAILLCIGLSALAVLIGFSFLRGVARQNMIGASETLHGLARDSALSGVAHACEQILLDYNAPSLSLVHGGGTEVVAGAPTHLDGPYRAPFVSLVYPNMLHATASSLPGAAYYGRSDDVREENHLLLPLIDYNTEAYTSSGFFHHKFGAQVYDGRGRYVEPGYVNVQRMADQAVIPIRFTDAAAVPVDRQVGLFLDKNFARLIPDPGEDQRDLRARARFRVRYAVGVEDLNGHLLSNPRAALGVDWGDSGNGYRVVPNWLDAAGYAWMNMAGSWLSNLSFGLRMDHVFRGRGSSSNADRHWTVGPQFGVPATFPMMLRSVSVDKPGVSKAYSQWWGDFNRDGRVKMAEIWNGDPSDMENLGGRLYKYNSWDARFQNIASSKSGNVILTPINVYPDWTNGGAVSVPRPFVHALMGPQISWLNQYYAAQGYVPSFVNTDSAAIGWGITGNTQNTDGGYDPVASAASATGRILTIPTPFGRPMERLDPVPSGPSVIDAPPADPVWYQGGANSPWLVNALTATPQTISSMLLAYMPPHVKNLKYTKRQWYKKTGEASETNPATNVVTVYDKFSSSPSFDEVVDESAVYRSIDILNDRLGSGFSDFPSPSSVDVGKPDFFQDDPYQGVAPKDRYPGILCRGDAALPDQGADDLGELIDADSRSFGYCTHLGVPLVFFGGGDRVWRQDPDSTHKDPELPTSKVKFGWVNNFQWEVRLIIDPTKYRSRFSYFWDMTYAFSQALAFARSNWVQYPNYVFDPKAGYKAPLVRDFRAYSGLEELDRAFLRQLREDFDDPDHKVRSNADCLKDLRPVDFVNTWDSGRRLGNPPNSIETARAIVYNVVPESAGVFNVSELVAQDKLKGLGRATSAARGKVLERMLNDFRLSFMGVSPAYRASFRPLDFDGDGQVHCSAYDDVNPADVISDDAVFHTKRYAPVFSNGRGPALKSLGLGTVDVNPEFGRNPWFCATGCFYFGKSHYYRIFSRGEVFDNLLGKMITSQTLESVVAVDPEAKLSPPINHSSANIQTLFQRWHHNNITSEMPLRLR